MSTPSSPDLLVIQWEDPPKRTLKGRPSFDWAAALEPLKAKPRKWGRVAGPDKTGKATTIKASLRRSGVLSDFEVVNRTVDGKAYTYARYVGSAR